MKIYQTTQAQSTQKRDEQIQKSHYSTQTIQQTNDNFNTNKQTKSQTQHDDQNDEQKKQRTQTKQTTRKHENSTIESRD